MARKANPTKSVKVQPSLHPEMVERLKELVGLGYGNTPTDVAKFLILRGIDDLLQTGLIGPGLKRRKICQSASNIDPLSACNIDPLSGTAEVVPVVNRGDPSGFV